MATEVQVETRFKGLEMLLASDAPFDKLQKALEKGKCEIAATHQVAKARIAAGKDNSVSQLGAYVAENLIYAPDGKIYVTSRDYSPILKYASKATEANRNGNEFYVSKKELEEIIKTADEDSGKEAEERRVYILERKEVEKDMDTSKFEQYEFARFMFKDAAKEYGAFLQKAGISSISTYLVDAKYQKEQKKPFARALWFPRLLGGRSVLYGLRSLGCGLRARGVRNASEASKTQKTAGTANAYESIAQNYVKSPAELQQVLEKYSQIKDLLKE